MKISPVGLTFLENWEKLVLCAKDDGYGFLSIGYGHCIKPGEKFPQTINRAQALDILRKDISWAEEAVNTLVRVILTQNQFDALVSLVYNIGRSNFENSKLRTFLNVGRFDVAADCFKFWRKSDGKISRA